MRRGRVFILIALILLLGAVAAYFLLVGRPSEEPAEEPSAEEVLALRDADIVIAAQDIARGAVIPEDGVIISPYPADYLVETMMTDIQRVVGRRARMDIARGVPITENMITEQAGDLLGTGSDAALAIPPGLTAIAIPISRLSSVAYAVQAGDQVDVLISMLFVDIDVELQSLLPNESALLIGPDGTLITGFTCRDVEADDFGRLVCGDVEVPPLIGYTYEDEESGIPIYVNPAGPQRPRLVTQRLIDNATVLHVGAFPLVAEEEVTILPEGPEPGAGAPPPSGTEVVEEPVIEPPDVISLIVTPQQALALNWAMKSGADLILTLRSPDDATETDTDSVTLQYLIENFDIVVPSKQPFGTEPDLQAPIRTFPESGIGSSDQPE